MRWYKIQSKSKHQIFSQSCVSAWLLTWSKHPLLEWLITQYAMLQMKCRRCYTASVLCKEVRALPKARRAEGKKRKIVEDGERDLRNLQYKGKCWTEPSNTFLKCHPIPDSCQQQQALTETSQKGCIRQTVPLLFFLPLHHVKYLQIWMPWAWIEVDSWVLSVCYWMEILIIESV